MRPVETIRLSEIRRPSRLEKLLEALVRRANLVPRHSYRLRDPVGLPSALRQILERAKDKDQVWNCWTDGARIWLFTAEMSLQLSLERGVPVLAVNEYTEGGRLLAATRWMIDQEGIWQRCSG